MNSKTILVFFQSVFNVSIFRSFKQKILNDKSLLWFRHVSEHRRFELEDFGIKLNNFLNDRDKNLIRR
jgi:hypothetical protein